MGWLEESGKVKDEFRMRFRRARARMKVYRSKVEEDMRIIKMCLYDDDIMRRRVPMPSDEPDCPYRSDAAGSKRSGGLGGYSATSTSCVREPEIDKTEVRWFEFFFKKGESEVCPGEPRKKISFLEGLASLFCFKTWIMQEPWLSKCQGEEVIAECDSNVFVLCCKKMKSKSMIHEVIREMCFIILKHKLFGFGL